MQEGSRNYTITATSISLNFNTIQDILPMLNRNASYQIIPSVPEVFSGSSWQIVLNLLEHSEQILIDICLPFLEIKNKKHIQHRARFLILNKKVLAIKIRSGPQWARYSMKQYKLPIQIIRFYKNNQIYKQDSCFIGQFFICLRGMKIAPLFASEIKENPGIISQYEKYGVDIISIIDDVEKISETQSINQSSSMFLGNLNGGFTVVYTGCKASINPLRSYWTNSFISHNGVKNEGNLNPFTPFMNISSVINVNSTGNLKNYSFFERNCENYSSQTKIIPSIDQRTERINFANPYIQMKQKASPQNKFSSFNKIHLYIWYIYNYINQQEPFTVGFPFTETIYSLVQHLNELAKILDQNKIIYKKPLLRIYKFDGGQANLSIRNDWRICRDAIQFESPEQMLEKQKGIKLFIYCDYTEQFKFFKERISTHKQIYICKNILADTMKVQNIDRRYLRKSAVQNSIVLWSSNRSFDKLCGEVLNSKHLTISQMISHFYQKNTDIKLLKEAFSKVMPDKIRQNMNFNAPHNFLLNNPPQVILNSVSQIFTNMELNNDERKNEKEEDEQKKGKQRRKDLQREKKGEEDLQSKIRQTNDSKLFNLKINVICHYCQGIVKKSLVKTCKICRNQACYQCLSKKYANRNYTLKDFEDLIKDTCSYCQGNCRCSLCSIKREKSTQQREEKQKQFQTTKYQIQSCIQCLIQQRPNRKKIKIECDLCHQLSCLECLKVDKEIKFNYEKNKWYCKACRNLYFNQNKVEEFKAQMSPMIDITQDLVVILDKVDKVDKEDKVEEEKKNKSPKVGSRSRDKKKSANERQVSSSPSSSSSSSSSSSQSSKSQSAKKKKSAEVQIKKKKSEVESNNRANKFDKNSNYRKRQDKNQRRSNEKNYKFEGNRNYNNNNNKKGKYDKNNGSHNLQKKNSGNYNSSFQDEIKHTSHDQNKPGLWVAADQQREYPQLDKTRLLIPTPSKNIQEEQIDY